MSEIDQFKTWLEIYLLELDKNFDTDVYLDYLYEMLTNFCPNPSNQTEIIENLHSTLESLLPDIKINKSAEIFDKYFAEVLNKEHINTSDLDETNFLSEIIKKDRNAIDKNKRENRLDPRYALDYKPGDVGESDDSSYSDEDIDAEFAAVRIQSYNKIDDVLAVFDSEKLPKSTGNKEKAPATKNYLKKNYESDDDDSNDPDYDPIFDETGKSNREAVDKADQELRQKMKEKHLQKKEKDKLDRAKQKELIKARKENEKKRTQKSEKRR